jgi:chlorite dismutase
MTVPIVKLDRGIHVLHLFYRIDRLRWSQLSREQSAQARAQLEALCAANSNASHPRLTTYANVGGKSDLAVLLMAGDLVALGKMHRDLENCFPPGTLGLAYSFLSVTELPEYVTTDEDHQQMLIRQEKLEPGSEQFNQRLAELRKQSSVPA